MFSAWRWCLVARGLRIRLPLGAAVADYYRALFLNAALPGGVLGDVHRAVRHGQSTGDIGRGVRAVVLERTAGQVVLVAVGGAVLLTHAVAGAGRGPPSRPGGGASPPLGAVAVLVAVRMNRAPGSPPAGPAPCAPRSPRPVAPCCPARNWPGVALSSVVVLAGHLGDVRARRPGRRIPGLRRRSCCRWPCSRCWRWACR